MYRVVTEQRGATVVAVPRRPAADGLGARRRRRRRARRARRLGRLAVQPEQPDRPAGAGRRHRDAARRASATDAADGRPAGAGRRARRGVRGVRRHVAPRRCARRYPDLIVVRTASKAYALAGPARRLRARAPGGHRPPQPVSAAGLRLHGVRDGRDRGAPRTRRSSRPTSPASRPSARASATALRRPAGRPGRRSRTSCSWTSARPSAPRRPRRASSGAASCRGRSAQGHPAAAYLRLTVRDPDENDRLIEAARDLATEMPRMTTPLGDLDARTPRGPARHGRPDAPARPTSP